MASSSFCIASEMPFWSIFSVSLDDSVGGGEESGVLFEDIVEAFDDGATSQRDIIDVIGLDEAFQWVQMTRKNWRSRFF